MNDGFSSLVLNGTVHLTRSTSTEDSDSQQLLCSFSNRRYVAMPRALDCSTRVADRRSFVSESSRYAKQKYSAKQNKFEGLFLGASQRPPPGTQNERDWVACPRSGRAPCFFLLAQSVPRPCVFIGF